MKGTSRAIRLLIFLVVITQAVPVLAQGNGFSVSPLVKRGDPTPGGGRFFDCNDCSGRIYGAHALNNSGSLVFWAETTGDACIQGLFIVSSSTSKLLAPGCVDPSSTAYNGGNYANLNDSGQAAFHGSRSIAGGIILYSQDQLTPIATTGDPTPVGTIFKGCGFSDPVVNNRGEIAFGACSDDDNGRFADGIFLYSSSILRPVVLDGDPSPIGGFFVLNFFPALDGFINDKGDVLFQSGVILDSNVKEKYGLFLATSDGIKKVVVDGDPLPNETIVFPGSLGIGDINDKSEVVFTVLLQGKADTGIFLKSGETIHKIMAQGDPTPIGGTFSTLNDPDLIDRYLFARPRLNHNGAVLFKAKVDGARIGLFLASSNALLKVATTGDQLSSGETIRLIDSFALNDHGQVAFFAYGKKDRRKPLGVFLAKPREPQITKIKLKGKQDVLELRVNGAAMITNDTVIEINGVPLGRLDYPADFREDGGTTRQVTSRDTQLEQRLPVGQSVQVTVYNPLTNQRSAPKSFVR
ncbi:MAG: hypothetical protein V7641_586 [Blastocatellia bacterium]